CGVYSDLADGDAHAPRALIAQAEDALIVGGHHQPHVLPPRIAEDLVDPAPMVRCDPQPPRAPEDVTELLARLPHRRGVDDRQELLEVIAEDAGEETLG